MGFHTLTNEEVDQSTSAFLVDAVAEGAPLVISFAFVSWDKPAQFDFYGRMKKVEALTRTPINKILVRDITNSWYHAPLPGLGDDVDQVATGLRALVEQLKPSRVITLGQSMGAYAAIMFGQLLEVDQVVAFGTLSHLHAEEALLYNDRRWLPVMQRLAAEPPPVRYLDLPTLCIPASHHPRIDLFFGTHPGEGAVGNESVNLDAVHSMRLATIPNCRIHPYPESPHAIVKYFIDRQELDSLLIQTLSLDRTGAAP